MNAKPRNAASVLLLRGRAAGEQGRGEPTPAVKSRHPGAPDLEVYMIRREESLRFLGGYYAFPGGQVDPEDHGLAREMLRGGSGAVEIAPAGNDGPDGEAGGAHRVAAVRELYEECGVLLARPLPGRARGSRLEEGRQKLLAGRASFAEVLERAGLRADVESLSFLDRWVTPEGLPIRYDTKFYTAWMPPGQCPDPYPGEVSWGGWVRPQEVLHDADSGRMPMVFSTLACLARLLEL